MNYPHPEVRIDDLKEELSDWAEALVILREARRLLVAEITEYICVACVQALRQLERSDSKTLVELTEYLQALRQLERSDSKTLVELTEYFSSRLQGMVTYSAWLIEDRDFLIVGDMAWQDVQKGRIAWIDDVIAHLEGRV